MPDEKDPHSIREGGGKENSGNGKKKKEIESTSTVLQCCSLFPFSFPLALAPSLLVSWCGAF